MSLSILMQLTVDGSAGVAPINVQRTQTVAMANVVKALVTVILRITSQPKNLPISFPPFSNPWIPQC